MRPVASASVKPERAVAHVEPQVRVRRSARAPACPSAWPAACRTTGRSSRKSVAFGNALFTSVDELVHALAVDHRAPPREIRHARHAQVVSEPRVHDLALEVGHADARRAALVGDRQRQAVALQRIDRHANARAASGGTARCVPSAST